PRHRRTGFQSLGALHPVVLRHFADGKPEIRWIRRTPRPAISEGIAFKPVGFRRFSSGVGIAGGMAIVASADFDDVRATLDLLRIRRRLPVSLSAHLVTQPGK